VKIDVLEIGRKVEDVKVDVRFDGREEERTGCVWCSQAYLLVNSTET
jgi:hypothetical protein